ncbi:hypothetical protein BGX38DRAFT_1269565 [Terfezia claveryi]|nr:hypothetical protein BGX38DRAFT_1269565 [Terfezia claveryi]
MGNASTREASSPYPTGHSRSASASSRYRSGSTNDARSSNPIIGGNGASGSGSGQAFSSLRGRDREASERARNLEHALFGLGIVGGSSRSGERAVRNREEEREAREARKREKEIEREKERQRSLREESCDGGFLVTQGVYTGPQDFKDKVVRHLMLERKLAPFWKGLPDHEDDWTDAQLIAAVNGIPMPGPEVECEPETPPVVSPGSGVPNASDSALYLSVPTGTRSRSHSYTSDSSCRSNIITGTSTARSRSKTLSTPPQINTVQQVSTTNPLETNLTGRYIDGRPIEVALYKSAMECPICFLYYPPYMNKTRCCDYDICSECFVQIKRADPHLPHDHEPQLGGSQEPLNPDLLMSEPASCPFCKETDFGVVYSPPPFRRGLVYTDSLAPTYIGSQTFSSDSSAPQSPGAPSSPVPGGGPRRKTALASTATEVVTTDQIRPDWAHKLQSARNQAARRAAAATALHNAAFLLNTASNNGSAAGLSGGFTSRRLMRRAGVSQGSESPSPGGSGAGTPRPGGAESLGVTGLGLLGIGSNGGGMRLGPPGTGATGGGPTEQRPGGRRARMVDLEEMMLREAIRLSILEEEARKAKEEEEKAKEKEEESLKAARGENVAGTDGGGEYSGGGSGRGNGNGKGKTVDRSANDAGESSAGAEGSSGSRGEGDGDSVVKRFAELSISYRSAEGGSQGEDVVPEVSAAR